MTEGIVNILKNGIMLYKIIIGCDGFNIEDLAKDLQKDPPNDGDEVYQRALQHVGCPKCLIVQALEDAALVNYWALADEDDLSDSYYDFTIFNTPDANPRSRGQKLHNTETVLLPPPLLKNLINVGTGTE